MNGTFIKWTSLCLKHGILRRYRGKYALQKYRRQINHYIFYIVYFLYFLVIGCPLILVCISTLCYYYSTFMYWNHAPLLYHYCKCNFPLNPHVHLSVGWLVCLSVGWSVIISLKYREVTLPCSYRSTCFLIEIVFSGGIRNLPFSPSTRIPVNVCNAIILQLF